MAAINARRVVLGAVLGGVVWTLWDFGIYMAVLAPRYTAAQNAGLFLKQPRYSFFVCYWIVTLFVVSFILAWLYASARATAGPGPMTALKIGVGVGFAAGFPMSLTQATWAPFDRIIPLSWMLDLWVGCVLASLVAGWLYKESA